MNESKVSRNSGLQDVTFAIDFTSFLLDTRDSYTCRDSSWVVSDGNCALFDSSRSTSRSIEGRNASRMSTETFREGTLRDKFERDFTLEIECFKFLVSTGT